jgi:DNA repair exonuclease SbcCD ATPase subunit
MLFKKKKTKKPKVKDDEEPEDGGQPVPKPIPEVTPPVETFGDTEAKEAKLTEWEADLQAKSNELRAWQEDLEARQKALEGAKGTEPAENGEADGFQLPEKATVPEWEKTIAEIKSFLAEATAKLEEAKELEETFLVLEKRIEEYHANGYNVERLKGAQKELSPEEVKELLTKFEEDLGVLKIFEEKLESLKPFADEAHLRQLQQMLKNPELISDIQDNIEALEGKMGQHKKDLETKIKGWAAEGFDVSRLEEAMEHDIKALMSEFSSFEAKLNRAKIILQKLDSLDPLFQQEIDTLKGKVKYLDHLDEVEEKVTELEEREEEKKKEFLEQLKGWQDKGYDVTRLENISSGNLANIETEFERYGQDIKQLETLAIRLKKLTNPKASKLEPYLKRPDEVTRLEKAIEKLETMEDEVEPAVEPPKPVPVEPRPVPKPVAPPVEPKPTPPPPTPTGDLKPPPAGAPIEDEAQYLIDLTDQLIERAKTMGKDVNTPNNLLRLAKSFMRSKNYDKAKQYAERVQKMVQDTISK